MSLEFLAAALLFACLVLYALTGGADFGGGVWDLLARGPRAELQRKAVIRALAPVWETNHIWLIAAVVLTFTAFPLVFSTLSIWLHVPLGLALLGVVLRGCAFVFRGYGFSSSAGERNWGRAFAMASAITPVFLGVCAGAVFSGALRTSRAPVGWEYFTCWLKPFPFAMGFLGLALLAFLAAVYLCVESQGEPDLQEDFRRRALASGGAVVVLSGISIVLARRGAPPAMFAAAAAAGAGAWAALWHRRWRLARALAAGLVVLVVLAWALWQFPFLVPPELDIAEAATDASILRPLLWAFLAGGAILVLPLAALFYVFKRPYL